MDTATQTEAPPASNIVELTIPTPSEPHEAGALTAQTYAEKFEVKTASDSLKAQTARARINTQIKTLNDARLAQTRPLDDAKKKIMAWWAKPITAYEAAKAIFDSKILAYDAEQDRIRREAQEKADRDARAERDRLQAIADAALKKAEEEAAEKRRLAAKAEEEGRAADAAKLNAAAEKVETKAEAKAESFTSRAASVVAPTLVSQSTRAAGSSFRDNWKWRLKDKAKINPAFLMSVPNEAAIDAMVKSMKGDAISVVGEGIEVYNERVLASRRA